MLMCVYGGADAYLCAMKTGRLYGYIFGNVGGDGYTDLMQAKLATKF